MTNDAILTINAGSSSIKFAVFDTATTLLASGVVDRIGAEATLSIRIHEGNKQTRDIGHADHEGALLAILSVLSEALDGRSVIGVGHRIVHGGPSHDRPAVLSQAVLDGLAGLNALAPLHQPFNLAGVAAARGAFPDAVQVGCFDTSFHRTHPWAHDVYALPQEYAQKGVRRYGFHGLSYSYIAAHLAETEPALVAGRVAVAHLGNGASMCAIVAGKSHASTMGFSAVDGLAMGTRTGQIDPGVLLYLLQTEGMDADALTDLLYRKSGLLGLSGISNDMRTLEADGSENANKAIAYFTTRIRHEIGALAADMGGIDALVFTGGIGENSARVRAESCEGMAWAGISLDPAANAANSREIGRGPTRVLVIPTNEEAVIAKAVRGMVLG